MSNQLSEKEIGYIPISLAFIVLITTISVFAHILFILILWMHGNAEHTVQMIKEHKTITFSNTEIIFYAVWIISLIIYASVVSKNQRKRRS